MSRARKNGIGLAVFCAWAVAATAPACAEASAGRPAAEESSAGRLWRLATAPLRERPIGPPPVVSRTAIRVDAAGRANPFLIPAVAGPERQKPDKRKPPVSQEATGDEIGAFLTGQDAKLRSAESAFDAGQWQMIPEKDLAFWMEDLEGLSPEAPEAEAIRLNLLARVRVLSEKLSATRTFHGRNYAVRFLIHRDSDPAQSVASISGRLVRAGETFDDGVEVLEIQAHGVTVRYRGVTFDLSMGKSQ